MNYNPKGQLTKLETSGKSGQRDMEQNLLIYLPYSWLTGAVRIQQYRPTGISHLYVLVRR